MSAPDPGLSDLIAAALYSTLAKAAKSGTATVDDLVASVIPVVEQHTNGRIAALEVDSANWKGRYDATHEVLRACTETWTRTIRDRDHWQARAEKAEATIARVEKLAHDMRGWCSPHGISVTYSDRICAVLEGE